MAREIECKYLELRHIETICYDIAKMLFHSKDYPMGDFIYLNKGLMESALDSVKQPYYESLFEKAATLGFQIIKGHALLDGNKRLGITATLVFLRINHHKINVPEGALLQMSLDVAVSKVSKKIFGEWLQKNSQKVKEPPFSFL